MTASPRQNLRNTRTATVGVPVRTLMPGEFVFMDNLGTRKADGVARLSISHCRLGVHSVCPYGSVSLHLRREDRPRDPESKDSEERLPIRPLESGVSTADSRAVGFGGAFDRKVAGDQEAECRAERVQLIGCEVLESRSPPNHSPALQPALHLRKQILQDPALAPDNRLANLQQSPKRRSSDIRDEFNLDKCANEIANSRCVAIVGCNSPRGKNAGHESASPGNACRGLRFPAPPFGGAGGAEDQIPGIAALARRSRRGIPAEVSRCCFRIFRAAECFPSAPSSRDSCEAHCKSRDCRRVGRIRRVAMRSMDAPWPKRRFD